MSTEKAIKWGTYYLLGWVVVVIGIAWVISFEFDPFGFNSGKFPYGGIAVLTFIAIIFWYITTRIIGEIFDIKYYKLFKLNPFSSGGYWMEIWESSSALGRFLLFLIIPEILFLTYLAITNNELLSGLWLPLFAHAWFLFKVCGKQIRASYRKHYGKEIGDAIYKSTYTTIKQTPYSLGARLINFKFILFVLVVNLIEFIIAIYFLNGFIRPETADFFTIILFTILAAVAIQDLLVLDRITRNPNKR